MTHDETSTGLDPKVAGLLCYLGVWITGIIFIVLEQKNRFVRFHAVQSIIVFAFLGVAGAIFGWIPVVGGAFSSIFGVIGFILWIVLMVKAYHGEWYRLPVAGELAERALGDTVSGEPIVGTPVAEPETPAAGTDTPPPSAPRPVTPLPDYASGSRVGRVIGSSITVAICFGLIIFFTFYRDFIAVYQGHPGGWLRYPILSAAFGEWYPLLMTALAVSIAGHLVVIIIDRYVLRESVMVALNLVWIAVLANLLRIFPFDFSRLPDPFIGGTMSVIFYIVIIGVLIGLVVGTVVSAVKLITGLVRGTAQT